MILKSLKLENIRSYLHETIEFPEGSVLLSGDIGSGKSTILLAIEFALFGIMRAELSGSSLLRHGKNQGSVELRFKIDKDEFLIKRTLKKSRDTVIQDTGYILINNKKIEGTPVELKARILNILGYPEELISKSKSMIYRYTVYTPQEEMKQILFEDKNIRLDTLRKLFGIDKYKTIKENADNFTRELRRKISELNIRLENYDELEKEKTEKRKKADEISLTITKAIHELEEIKKILQKEKNLLENFEQEVKKENELKKQLDLKEVQISNKKSNKDKINQKIEESQKHVLNIEKRLESYSKVEEIIPEKELEKEINKLNEDLNVLIKEKSTYLEKIRSFEEQIKNIEEEVAEFSEKSKQEIILKSKLREVEEKIKLKKNYELMMKENSEKEKNTQIHLEKINILMIESQKIVSSIKDAEICPTCNQKVDEDHKRKVISEEKEKLKRYNEEKNKLTEFLKKISENLEKIQRNIERIEKIEESYKRDREAILRLEEYSKQLIKKQKELSEFFQKKKEMEDILKSKETKKEETLRSEIEHKRKFLSEARDNNLKVREKKNLIENIGHEKENIKKLREERMDIEKEIEDLSKNKKKIEDSLKDYFEINQKYEKQKEHFEKNREMLKYAEIEFATFSKEKNLIIKQIEDIEKKLSSLDKIKEKIKEISEIENWIKELFLNLMATIEKHIMVSIHKEFEYLLKEWFSILIEDIEISLDEEFTVKVIQDGYETEVESLSGGEKTSVALAYRLSLNKVINDLISGIRTKDFIILDEPTDGFSTEQLDKVREVLEQLNMKQTIVVSHEQKMESYVDNIIRINKTENVSTISY